MSLKFVLGNSGSGKTEYIYREITRRAGEDPRKNFLVIVPEQFTMQTQKKLVELAPNHAIMNIDVLSFKRLAYRVFDEQGMSDTPVLEETGKNLVLRKVAKEKEEQLTVLRPNMSRMGYVGELKSLLSEFMQYNITPEQLEEYRRTHDIPNVFSAKLRDIITMYRGFLDDRKGKSITAEEILVLLIPLVKESYLLRDSVIVLDEFTGFTPIQNQLLQEFLTVAEEICVLLTIDAGENFYRCTGEHELFYLTKKTIASLQKMAAELAVPVEEPLILGKLENPRFGEAEDLAFLEQNLFRPWYKKYGEEPKNIHIFTGENPREELAVVAREINRLVRQKGYRYRDIAVVTGAVETYGNYVEEIFEKYRIPCFLDETTEILFHPFIELIRSVFGVFDANYSYDSVMRFLRCGFTGISEEELDVLDNYLLATGIRGHEGWHKRFLRRPRDERNFDLELLEEIRRKILSIWEPLEEVIRNRKFPAGEAICGLYRMLLNLDAEQQLWEKEKEFLAAGQQAKSKEYGQIYAIVMGLLEQYDGLLGEEIMDAEAFSEVLEAGLSAAKVAALPPGYDSVTIGDIERTRLNRIRILFFVGVNDGVIPKNVDAGGIISEYERGMLESGSLELAPGAREKAFIQRFYLYRNLTKPSKKLYLSYAKVDAQGKAQRPSYLIGVIHRIFPKLSIAKVEELAKIPDYSGPETALDYLAAGEKDTDWYTLAHYLMEQGTPEEKNRLQTLLLAPYAGYEAQPISRAVARALYGNHLATSVTRLERFAACAYAHFLQYGLGLRERESSSFQGIDMGTLYHEALEKYSNKLKASEYDWFTVPDALREELAESSMQEAVLDFPALSTYATEENSYLAKRMERIFKQTVWALTKQVRKGSFVPKEFELEFRNLEQSDALKMELEKDAALQLLGRIDRLDTCVSEDKAYVKVIDYKSSKTKFDLIRIYRGMSLQLVVYMNVAMNYVKEIYPDKAADCGGILYYNIDEPILEEADGDVGADPQPTAEKMNPQMEEELLAALKPDGLVNSEEEVFRLMDGEINGKSLVIPVELKKDGALSSRSHTASSEEFQLIGAYVNAVIRQQGKRIFAGDVAVNPYRDGAEKSCTYCPYGGVCGIDGRLPGYEFRHPEAVSKEQVLERMQTDMAVWREREK